MANLAVLEGIRLPDAAVSLDHPIVSGFLGHQVQCFLNGLTRGLGTERLLCPLQLVGIQPCGNLDTRHEHASCMTKYIICMTKSTYVMEHPLGDTISSRVMGWVTIKW